VRGRALRRRDARGLRAPPSSRQVPPRPVRPARAVSAPLHDAPARPLMRAARRSLCAQLTVAYGRAAEAPTPGGLVGLARLLRRALEEWPTAERPLLLFLDGLERLDPGNAAHQLDWLPTEHLSPHARVVLSAAPDARDIRVAAWLRTRLAAAGRGAVEVVLEEPGDPTQAAYALLARRGRQLTAVQQHAVRKALTARARDAADGTMVWLAAAAAMLARWRSFDGVLFPLRPSLRELLQDNFRCIPSVLDFPEECFCSLFSWKSKRTET